MQIVESTKILKKARATSVRSASNGFTCVLGCGSNGDQRRPAAVGDDQRRSTTRKIMPGCAVGLCSAGRRWDDRRPSALPGARQQPLAGSLGSRALVAQGIEHRFPKPCVASSNLAGGTRRTPHSSPADPLPKRARPLRFGVVGQAAFRIRLRDRIVSISYSTARRCPRLSRKAFHTCARSWCSPPRPRVARVSLRWAVGEVGHQPWTQVVEVDRVAVVEVQRAGFAWASRRCSYPS